MLICVADKFDKNEREKERGQKIEGAVLIARDAEVRTRLFPGKLQVDLVMACDFSDLSVLENLKTGTQPDDHAAANIFTGLLKNRVGSFCGMRFWQALENGVQFGLSFHGKQIVNLPDIPVLGFQILIDI